MVLKVDLECERCNKKIKRVLDKMKDKMNINTITVDEERNLVIISGQFDADKVRRKLCCEASRIIKGMDVVVKATEEKKDGDIEKEEEEDGRKTAAAAAPPVNLRPLLEKMLERPKARTQPAPPCTCCSGCRCCGGKQTAQPPAAQVVVAAPARTVVSGHGYGEAPTSYYCYGVPVYSVEEW